MSIWGTEKLNDFQDMNVLITGGAGFIGSHLVDSMMQNGARVRVLDDMSNGSKDNLAQWIDHPRFNLMKKDIRNINAVANAVQDIQLVFHQAAKVSVPFSVKEPYITMEINAMGTAILLDECRKGDVEKIVVASSSSVYGNTPEIPKRESMPASPNSPYAVSKLAEERLAIAYHRTYGMNTTALRYFNVYGPRQRGGPYAGVISIFITNALQNRNLQIDGDGLQTRDFTFIQDVVNCNILAASSPASEGRVYNAGAGKQVSILRLADLIIKLTSSKSTKSHRSPRIGDVNDSLASLDCISEDLGYYPKVSLKNGLSRTISWYENKLDMNSRDSR